MEHESSQTKHSKLSEYLKEQMVMGKLKPGDQIPSENALVEKFSISRHTVRKAISMLVNDGYLYTEHGRGTFCRDRNANRRNSKNIGVITTYISEYIFPRVIQGIDSVLSAKGYSIMLKNTNNDTTREAVYLEDMIGKDIAGLIIEPTKSALFSNNIKFYDALDSNNIPYVFIHGCYQQIEPKPQVVLDDTEGMYMVVKYIGGLGHKNIVGIFKADDVQGVNRHKGYAKALSECGILYNPDNVIWFHTEDRSTKPVSVVRDMLSSGTGIDAIACYNDQVAFSIYQMLVESGRRIPEDISLTGFDDSYLSVNCPVKLTTVSHPKEKLGEAAAELLLDMIGNRDYLKNPVRKIIKPELIIRDSCKVKK
jgi:GntR family transcriptional regulator of arabinose operon